jgi:hypothetical protein
MVHENNNTDIDRHSLPPNHSATAPTTKPPAISTTSTSDGVEEEGERKRLEADLTPVAAMG